MAIIDISQLPTAISLDGTEKVPIDQSGVTKSATTQQIAGLPIAVAPFVVASPSGLVPQARTLAGTGGQITVTDGGAGEDITLALAGTAVSPGTYGDSSHVPQITLDNTGRALSASSVAISGSSIGALLKANNLSDLTDIVTARANLSLGNSATRNVGTTSGTVAAGDDSRIVNAIETGTATSGDLSGNLPGPITVAKVAGVTPSTVGLTLLAETTPSNALAYLGGVPGYTTVAAAQAATINSGVNKLYVYAFDSNGYGAGYWVRYGLSAPSINSLCYFRNSVDNYYWVVDTSSGSICVDQIGALGNGVCTIAPATGTQWDGILDYVVTGTPASGQDAAPYFNALMSIPKSLIITMRSDGIYTLHSGVVCPTAYSRYIFGCGALVYMPRTYFSGLPISNGAPTTSNCAFYFAGVTTAPAVFLQGGSVNGVRFAMETMSTTPASGNYSIFIGAAAVNDMTVERCEFVGLGIGAAFWHGGLTNSRFINNYSHDFYDNYNGYGGLNGRINLYTTHGDDVRYGGYSINFQVRGNVVKNNVSGTLFIATYSYQSDAFNINALGAADTTITDVNFLATDNQITNCPEAFDVQSPAAIISNNRVIGSWGAGIKCPYSPYATKITGNTVSGCTIWGIVIGPAAGLYTSPNIITPYMTVQNNTIYNMNPNNESHTNSSCIYAVQGAVTTNYLLNGTISGNNIDASPYAQYCEVRGSQGGMFWQNNLIGKGVAGWVNNVYTADAQGNQKPLNSTMVNGYLSNTTPFTINNTQSLWKVPFDTIVTDTQNEWSAANVGVLLKRRGRYQVNFQVPLTTMTANASLNLYVNLIANPVGSNIVNVKYDTYPAVALEKTGIASCVINAASENLYVQFYVQTNDTTTRTVDATDFTRTNFSIFQVG